MNEEDEPPSRRGPLIAIGVIILIILAGLWLSNTLGGVSRIQDCVMSGRSNCVQLH
jgi:hypothetical protein